ncbi:desmoglein-2-like protein [Sardina pilchardus]|uniref:desmoglein-2-like protein n=1 Tax=Sardina pilchardus TaxID=27697 RepID=UPI002E15F852
MAHAASVIRLIVPILILILQVQGYSSGLQKLQRQKREWIIPPKKLLENKDYTKMEYISKIRSDEETRTSIRYFLEGKGASEAPMNLFTVNHENGYVRINGILDREETPYYYLKGVAKFADGTRAEKDIDLVIEVLDVNDCPPVFSFVAAQSTSEIFEASSIATYVMKINATDADMPNTPNSQIAYTIVEQSPPGGSMFYINQETGGIFVNMRTLDRETHDTYTLTIKGSDMNGAAGGLSGTGKVVIKLLDVNDNIPTLEKSFYEANVMENTVNVTVVKIQALDLDLKYTDNWLAVYTIVSGNEAGYFSITTDTKTNEGILVLNKPLNYEELQEVNLRVSVSNKAEYHSSTIISQSKTYPIKIHVQNEPEGPRFQPQIKVVTVSEDSKTIDFKTVITTYKAIDSDTLMHATNVIYAKGEDKDNWISIDRETAEIRLNKYPDRESKHLVNGTYYAKIICISKEAPVKTATGTIAIQVDDFNDNCPKLTSTSQSVCFPDDVVYVTAVDKDPFPNGAPFEFKVVSDTKERWTVERLNDTTVILRPKETLWPGLYKVFLEIQDEQGKACAGGQVLDLEVCSCTKGTKACLDRGVRGPTAILGPAGILLLLLGLVLLFLLPLLLLFCLCGDAATKGGFVAMPWEAKQHLISYHTEGQGEDKEVPLVTIPTVVDGTLIKAIDGGGKGTGIAPGWSGQTIDTTDGHQQWISSVSTVGGGYDRYGYGQGQGQGQWQGQGQGQYDHWQSGHKYQEVSSKMGAFEGIALSEGFLQEYYSQKAHCIQNQHSPKEALLIFDYEGQESPVGSIGCCSLLQDDQDLDFLNDLGPKFKTLADICGGTSLEVESSKVTVTASQPSAPIVANVDVFADITHSINAARTEAASLATSSTRIQESVISSTRPATTDVHLRENFVVPTQTLLIQQPTLYYTAAAPPMYVVDPQPHQTLVVGPAVNMGENMVVVERQATTGGSAQLQGLSQGVIGVESLHGAQSLILLEGGRASVAGDPHQIVGTLGKRQVVTVETCGHGLQSGSATQIGHGESYASGNVSLSGSSVSSESRGLQYSGGGGLIQVLPSQGLHSESVDLRGQGVSMNVPLEAMHEGTHKVVVQERVSVTERNIQSSSTA